MSKWKTLPFKGYIVTEKVGDEIVEVYDFRIETLQKEPGIKEWEIPYCPLAAASKALMRKPLFDENDRLTRFERGEFTLHVCDPTRRSVDIYDGSRYDYECELERLAG